jgi:hypothetical protein
MLDRLRRVTDLFVEGTEVFLGTDDDGKPVTIWVNKLNSFETEEARRDGMVRRGQRMIELAKDDNPEYRHILALIETWSDDQLREARVEQRAEEIYLEVINDIQGDKEWAEKLAVIRRMPTLLEDEKAPASDPRHAQLEELQNAYLTEIRQRQETKAKQALRDLASEDRETVQKAYVEAWRERVTLDDFMQERRATELFYAMRDCYATQKDRDADTGRFRWDHSKCNHAERLLQERKQVRELPEHVLNQVIDAIDEITVNQRESGNSDAPASSSASSEPQSEEEDSPASIPVETSHGAPMT